jgi:hypothetical protein
MPSLSGVAHSGVQIRILPPSRAPTYVRLEARHSQQAWSGHPCVHALSHFTSFVEAQNPPDTMATSVSATMVALRNMAASYHAGAHSTSLPESVSGANRPWRAPEPRGGSDCGVVTARSRSLPVSPTGRPGAMSGRSADMLASAEHPTHRARIGRRNREYWPTLPESSGVNMTSGPLSGPRSRGP